MFHNVNSHLMLMLIHQFTLPCNLSIMAGFADIIVSQGIVATYARCGGMFNIHLTTNLPRNLPVKKFVNRLRFDRIMVESVYSNAIAISSPKFGKCWKSCHAARLPVSKPWCSYVVEVLPTLIHTKKVNMQFIYNINITAILLDVITVL